MLSFISHILEIFSRLFKAVRILSGYQQKYCCSLESFYCLASFKIVENAKLLDIKPHSTLHWTKISPLKTNISGTQPQVPSLRFLTREWLLCNCNLMNLYLKDLNCIFIYRFFKEFSLRDSNVQYNPSFKHKTPTDNTSNSDTVVPKYQASYFTVLLSTSL